MIRILFLIVLGFSASFIANGAQINLSREVNYDFYTKNGLTYGVHSSFLGNKNEIFLTINHISEAISQVEKIIPDTFFVFKKENYKIFLYEFSNSEGGMEFVREGQHKWDKNKNPVLDCSILIFKAYSAKEYGRSNTLPYLLHEMAHFLHIRILKGSLDAEIIQKYQLALRNPRYKGSYALTNYLEYFAEISMSYLLESHEVSLFPSGSRELYLKDRDGYGLCEKIWGKDLSAFRKSENRVLSASDRSVNVVTVNVRPVLVAQDNVANIRSSPSASNKSLGVPRPYESYFERNANHINKFKNWPN